MLIFLSYISYLRNALIAFLCIFVSGIIILPTHGAPLEISEFENVIKPFTQKYCLQCHGVKKQKGDFRLDLLIHGGVIDSESKAELWQEVLDVINIAEMPPHDEKQPTKKELTLFLDALYQTTENARDVISSKGSGRMRRMNSREYINTIYDLVGIKINTNLITEDIGSLGFDTFGYDLNLSYAEIDNFIAAGDSIFESMRSAHFSKKKKKKHRNISAIFGKIPRNPSDDKALPFLTRFTSVFFQNKQIPTDYSESLHQLFLLQRKQGLDFWSSMKAPISAALSSPNFIYVIEANEQLTQVEVANRLALLLWSSIPDGSLLRDAKAGKLYESNTLDKHVNRMLNDKKSERFFTAFFNQWLELDRIEQVSFDESLYPEYKKEEEKLKRDMWNETLAYTQELVKQNMEAKSLVNSNFAMLNQNLAKHYGIPLPKGDNVLKKVNLPASQDIRGGILGQGAFQILTSNGSRTSPVERGVYIMRKLLDSPPPPAPADVPEAEDTPKENQTTRELLAHHMTNAQCATCHQKIDSIGFGIESFDALGRWRSKEGQKLIDTTGRITDGTKFKDFKELRSLLSERDQQIAQSFTKALMGYAIGRPIRFNDRGDIDQIIKNTKGNNFPLKDILIEVVKSNRFKSKS